MQRQVWPFELTAVELKAKKLSFRRLYVCPFDLTAIAWTAKNLLLDKTAGMGSAHLTWLMSSQEQRQLCQFDLAKVASTPNTSLWILLDYRSLNADETSLEFTWLLSSKRQRKVFGTDLTAIETKNSLSNEVSTKESYEIIMWQYLHFRFHFCIFSTEQVSIFVRIEAVSSLPLPDRQCDGYSNDVASNTT